MNVVQLRESVQEQMDVKQVEKEDKQVSEVKEKKDGRANPRSKEQMEALSKARIALNESYDL